MQWFPAIGLVTATSYTSFHLRIINPKLHPAIYIMWCLLKRYISKKYFLQNWNISSSDTLKPKIYSLLTFPSFKYQTLIKFLKISTNGNINETAFNKIMSKSRKV